MGARDLTIEAADGYPLIARILDGDGDSAVVVNPAMAIPASFYRHMAEYLNRRGHTVITYDYRGVGASRPDALRGFEATIMDWVELDMAAAVSAASETGSRIHLLGHSLGGQLAGLLPDESGIRSMVTIVAQSGHWRLQGGMQPIVVALHGYLTLPVLARACGYMPFRRIGFGEDVPKGPALQWARWTRHPDYLFGDPTLPLERYSSFDVPTLAYSIADDDWGSARAVDAMMSHYPRVERRHLVPADHGLDRLGHLGAFRPGAEPIWDEIAIWLERT